MVSGVYREFVLNGRGAGNLLTEFLRQHAGPELNAGRPLRVIVTSEAKRRNAEQNRRLWGFVYRCIADQAMVNGRHFGADVWHEHFARMFAEHDEVTLPDGEVILKRKSTADMSVRAFAEYMERVTAYAATELGVVFHDV